ncbi:MAG: 23S rRNA (adenine(2503)-C(2))-methyltransferase RlmN [Eubacterium sp.]|nr:23S rRNA (adenine(2503)-C(2))-methyltransferase RlmN [Eubacterium sp.]CDE18233.1 probable dual-specificity RNA methyltransferase RlmN [Eubacterium sp. CAG:841]
MTDLLSLSLAELENYIVSIGEPKFRAKQIFGWLMKGRDLDGMNNVPRALTEKLKGDAFVSSVKLEEKRVSSDGTQKFLFSLYDGERIESVLMKYERGYTVCISTEAGCPMGCAFCASTLGGLSRRLLPGEMLSQVMYAQAEAGEKLSGIVLMGIGEPLDNYDNVLKFLRLVGSPDGLNIGYRHISLSTCGLVDKIYRLAEEDLPITLSISLHASDNETRSALMPVNKKWCIEELLVACRDYFAKTGRRISFEYTLAAGKNDTEKDARALSAILKKYCGDMPLHVNLIPVNATGRGFSPSDRANVNRFAEVLEKNHIVATVRRHLGGDINASCGQLRAGSKS